MIKVRSHPYFLCRTLVRDSQNSSTRALYKNKKRDLIIIKGTLSSASTLKMDIVSLETGAALHITTRMMRMLTRIIVGISSRASTLTMDTVSLKTDAAMHITSRKWRLLACLKTVLKKKIS